MQALADSNKGTASAVAPCKLAPSHPNSYTYGRTEGPCRVNVGWGGSHENTSSKSRHAYSVHFVESSGAAWDDQNWLQRAADIPFKPFEQAAAAATPERAVPPMRKVGSGI